MRVEDAVYDVEQLLAGLFVRVKLRLVQTTQHTRLVNTATDQTKQRGLHDVFVLIINIHARVFEQVLVDFSQDECCRHAPRHTLHFVDLVRDFPNELARVKFYKKHNCEWADCQ